MPTIKIVPMPGVATPGPQGPRGYQGDPGLPGAPGADANIGDLEFAGNTITAHGDMTIGVDVVPGELNLSAYSGVEIQTAEGFGLYVNGRTPADKVVTVKDIPSIVPPPVAWTPVLSATNFAQTSNPATGTYVRYGRMVFVNLTVPMTNVTNFGTGQYSITLPFPPARHGDAYAGTLHDADDGFFTLKGHYSANDTNMSLWYISIVSKDAEFDNNSPILLTTADEFHMNFTYEIAQ